MQEKFSDTKEVIRGRKSERRTDTRMATRKEQRQTIGDKTPHQIVNIKRQEPHKYCG